MIWRAFSLIELMVVIAIIATLAGISVPMYKYYTIKTKIMSSMLVLQTLSNASSLAYEKTGMWTNPGTFNGVDISNGWAIVNAGNVYSMLYTVASNGVFVKITLKGLTGISGYADPFTDPVDSPAHKQTLSYAMQEVNGVMQSVCGSYVPGGPGNIPPEYLPSSCDCKNVNAWWNSGGQSNSC